MRTLTPVTERLAERLRASTEAAMRVVPEPDTAQLRARIRELRAMVAGAGGAPGGGVDRLREETRRFRRTGNLHDGRAARLVCWSTILRDGKEPPLIEESELFPALIDQVDGYRPFARAYRSCWRGLLDGYVKYDPESARGSGHSNWLVLRDWLNDNLNSLERGRQPPDWLVTIEQHANLLTEDPCGRYGADLLDGDGEVLEALRRELAAGDSSWIARRIFEAQIAAAVAMDDARLRQIMPRLVQLLDDHDLLADAALARILDRYAQSRPIMIENGLRDLSVRRWGNPWLGRNESRWAAVQPETRKMISSWLKLDLIEKFFSLLSEDQLNDQRRIDFWKRYVDRIDDMHFALGETAYSNRSEDFRALRKAMGGRLLRLESGGSTKNNAFIMRMGDRIFVEFGEKGNAMFVFDANSLPFSLTSLSVAGNKSALKHARHLARIVHIDSAGERWERKIEHVIDGTSAVRVERRPTTSPPGSLAAGVASFRHHSSSGEGALRGFLAEHHLRADDRRGQGGALWVYAPAAGAAAAGLRRHGFAWSARRHAWYLKQ